MFCLPAASRKPPGRMKMHDFLRLPRVFPTKGCHCSSEPIMSVTLSAVVISLLPAAVAFFHSHKDNIWWYFDGKWKETIKIGHSEGRCC